MTETENRLAVPIDRMPFTSKTLQLVVNTDLVPKEYRGSPTKALAAILTGRELGLGPMQSLRYIDVIEGRAAPSGEYMANRILAAGHMLEATELTAETCTLVGIRRERQPDGTMAEVGRMTFTFTADMAHRAGLHGKKNWRTYPEAMLYWRCLSQLARFFFADVIGGLSHTPEELGSAEWHEPSPVTVEDTDVILEGIEVVPDDSDEPDEADVAAVEADMVPDTAAEESRKLLAAMLRADLKAGNMGDVRQRVRTMYQLATNAELVEADPDAEGCGIGRCRADHRDHLHSLVLPSHKRGRVGEPPARHLSELRRDELDDLVDKTVAYLGSLLDATEGEEDDDDT